jgi:AhpC/TSA family
MLKDPAAAARSKSGNPLCQLELGRDRSRRRDGDQEAKVLPIGDWRLAIDGLSIGAAMVVWNTFPMQMPLKRSGTRRKVFRWLARGVAALLVVYVLFGGVVVLAMMQPPERFGRFMRHVPMALVWGVLPGPKLWLWARQGTLRIGDQAPDFTLSTHDHKEHVTLSSFRGQRPVVLVFGSYT